MENTRVVVPVGTAFSLLRRSHRTDASQLLGVAAANLAPHHGNAKEKEEIL